MNVRAIVGRLAAFFIALSCAGLATAQSMNLAPGFTALPKGAKVAIMPPDVELFELSAGGVMEPKAEWTEAGLRHFRAALAAKQKQLGLDGVVVNEKDADDFAEINALHAAVARAIAMHHFGISNLKLPTKQGKLDWSMGDPVAVVKKATGADYALFSFVRDSYASSGHVATTVALALIGVVRVGGASQTGYATLVDLTSGRVVWANRLARPQGDMREESKAAETLDALLTDFPVTK